MTDRDSLTVSLGMAQTEELPKILALVETCGLPKEGLADHLSTILVARKGKQIVGCAGLELYQDYALLRSVAVDPSFRHRGIGQRLVRASLDLANLHQVTNLYLLTETASEFFFKLGFRNTLRSDVPQKAQGSIEFTTLCPDTSLVMSFTVRKRMDDA